MAGPKSRVAGGGFWSQPQVQYSAGTHQLLKDMMQESKLTNFQQRHLEKTLRGGGPLPTQCAPTSSSKKKPTSAPQKKQSKVLNARNYKPVLRTKEQMEEMGAFEKPDYTPLPNTRGQDKDRQRERLANIMAFGKDIDPKRDRKMARSRPPPPEDDDTQIDRFDELQLEIDERRAFLSEMEQHGQGAKYRPVIETEISQKIREMELIDKKRTAELERLLEADRKKQQSSS
ncbi:UPF0193 protein EVG1 homolog [Ostrea edulis]|uniref:UPF0193 protein EVG1 homolog n=1 Tax=Ostrea edulis TaxID=37623 RepID=UPI0020964DC7|nr:UPF0193 protein EVG1 homolog [Ostrea edulis]